MPEIPEEAVNAAAHALRTYHGPDDEPHLSAAMFKGEAAAVVEAVAPILAAHIARRIKAQQPAGNTRLTWRSGRDRAAKVARETYPPATPNTPTGEQQP